MIEERAGFAALRVSGKQARDLFEEEAGGHRWQRVSPTEKRGRVHTSTITVAVMSEPTETQVRIDDRDLDWKTCRGSGAGGQNRNKRDTAVQLTHKPTGLSVRYEAERTQDRNKSGALALLRARIWDRENTKNQTNRSAARKSQIGSGMRGDKRRTIRVRDDSVVDHETGRSWSFKNYSRGIW